MKPKIHLIVGARPNYIKANPVYNSLNRLNKFEIKLVNTGQHYDENMSKIFIHELGMKKPDINLEVGSGLHGEQTGKILSLYEKVVLIIREGSKFSFSTTKSTATPIKTSGAMSKILLRVEHSAAKRAFARQGLI